MDKNQNVAEAPGLIAGIIDGIFREAPDAVVLVAPVIFAKPVAIQERTTVFNKQLEDIVQTRRKAGKHLISVPIDIKTEDLSDDKHPNNAGYEKMAQAWWDAILVAHKLGWIGAPANVQVPNLNNDGRADYIVAEADGTVNAWINLRLPNDFKSIGKINPAWTSVEGSMIRMAVVDNDGKADMTVLYSDGVAKVWKNTDDGRKFEPLDSKWAAGVGETRDKVRITDIDGDGYADYVIIYSGGAVKWARNMHNNGKDSTKKNWEDLKTIAPGVAGTPDDTPHMLDLDGDGKAGGAIKAYMNSGNLNSDPNERNWNDFGTIAPGVSGVTGDMIRFADMSGDGRADFLAVSDDGSIRTFENIGLVQSKVGSMRFADLTGNGRDDIIVLDHRTIAAGVGDQGPVLYGDVNGDIVYVDGSVGARVNKCNWGETPPCISNDDVCALAVISFPDTSCSAEKQAAIVTEMQRALEIAEDTAANLQRGVYFDSFFDRDSRADPDFAGNTARVYGNIADMLSASASYKVTATCDEDSPYCRKQNFFAYMNDDAKRKVGKVNFCRKFWSDQRIVTTESILSTIANIPFSRLNGEGVRL
ncbi:hypothetical protein B0J13DRAFT_524884 [Dactylonectria estremocensis]|uniref:SGNH hydrolase-type esterase domain-containing protein n=1 Tax=Dactylonectria estremocensis TaxID=1079267 RepID=A0A9P9J367_9HYPO|nr:hypothetical protein B0J13DRAFT_524884 [Dactylonectria estremocensis]